MRAEVVIFGGGVAGLWTLDVLVRRGFQALLLEANGLGHGQTVASQGIIHGGLKYALQGLLTPAAQEIREMPLVWRSCLAGQSLPDLSLTRMRAQSCSLWRTDSVKSRLGMVAAKWFLRVSPRELPRSEWPEALARCPGTVTALDEQVLSPASLMESLSRPHRDRILKVDADAGCEFITEGNVHVSAVVLRNPQTAEPLEIHANTILLAAGGGNAKLRAQLGLSETAMQRRPLQMVMVRGDLPVLNGHCIDANKTRVTITSDVDSSGRTVWQVGGQVSEVGVSMDTAALLGHARAEVRAAIPGINLCNTEWATYRIDRAEGATGQGLRPDSVQVLREGNVITAWPTKLALAPRLAEVIAGGLGEPSSESTLDLNSLRDWPRPAVALPPWETCTTWQANSDEAREAA